LPSSVIAPVLNCAIPRVENSKNSINAEIDFRKEKSILFAKLKFFMVYLLKNSIQFNLKICTHSPLFLQWIKLKLKRLNLIVTNASKKSCHNLGRIKIGDTTQFTKI
jgi:hypothetical protein